MPRDLPSGRVWKQSEQPMLQKLPIEQYRPTISSEPSRSEGPSTTELHLILKINYNCSRFLFYSTLKPSLCLCAISILVIYVRGQGIAPIDVSTTLYGKLSLEHIQLCGLLDE